MKNPNEIHRKGTSPEQSGKEHLIAIWFLPGGRTFSLMFIYILLFQFAGFCSYQLKNGNDIAQKAFELRMNGKVDEAKKLVDDLLAKDSTNAQAYYELARIQTYMFLAQANVSLDDIILSINKAVVYDPKNVIYAYYKAMACFLKAFMAMQTDQQNVKNRISETCSEFQHVLQLKPDYYEAMLYLVEIYGMLPGDMGGDSVKAAKMVEKLAKMDNYFGAKAHMAVAPESTDRVNFWNNLLQADKNNANILAELCKAYLGKDEPDNAKKYGDLAIALDPSRNILLLDQARYHVLTTLQNKDLAATELPLAKNFVESYLNSKPAPIVPLKAYALGVEARIEMFSGNQQIAENLMTEAKSADPYFSRAMGIPLLILFDQPDQVSHHFVSFFSPF